MPLLFRFLNQTYPWFFSSYPYLISKQALLSNFSMTLANNHNQLTHTPIFPKVPIQSIECVYTLQDTVARRVPGKAHGNQREWVLNPVVYVRIEISTTSHRLYKGKMTSFSNGDKWWMITDNMYYLVS